MVAIGVIGSGAWGTTLALLLARQGIATTLWEHSPARARQMQEQRENTLFLPGFPFPETLQVTESIVDVVQHKDLLLLVTPSQRLRENLHQLAPYLSKDTILVSASKGIETTALNA